MTTFNRFIRFAIGPYKGKIALQLVIGTEFNTLSQASSEPDFS